jgi:DNA-binding FadR family transcriptional regulator
VTNINSFKSLKRAPAYVLAEEAIRGMILDGTLARGDLLPVEYDLAEQLGVTRPTVREAL